MSEINDDPKEVLSILNSLGFVGITASQLKSFMKDLKLYRKIKERDREAWKEEIKGKILAKQRRALSEFIQEQEAKCTRHTEPGKIIPPESPRKGEAVVKIKIKYSPKGKENDEREASRQCRLKTRKSASARGKCDFWMKDLIPGDSKYPTTSTRTSSRECTHPPKSVSREKSVDEPRNIHIECAKENIESASREKSRDKTENTERRTPRLCHKFQGQKRPASAPEVASNMLNTRTKSMISDPGETASSCVTKTSGQLSQRKSFIRPWRLNPETHRKWKKSDPVALYQKYQEEWKHCPLPGENRHKAIRWAIREKMMGSDPHPRPAVYQPSSTSALKR
ncbi:uncharacterized protein LOC117178142 [Belonocnema kinseyi]|uniref:uncharacterized protein LOC117178142 n=1 Tax=Belonocnema kinseyi TaxID=2817044 RepID=UPI00143DB601|nr:uncharacterized protein LOC117178142 [Belonocnema kinseyi]